MSGTIMRPKRKSFIVLKSFIALLILAMLAVALPATPALPTPEASGIAPVNGIRLWYAEFGTASPGE